MKHALAGLALFLAGAALGTWRAGPAPADAAATSGAAPGPGVAATSVATAPTRYALQAWEGCRPLDAGGAFSGPATRTLALADGRRVEVSLVPVTRDNGVLVFDTLVRYAGGGGARSQVGFQSPLLSDGVLMRAVDLDGVSREVAGPAAYIHRPHPMAR